jgi:release factor glutamine methyltransferase
VGHISFNGLSLLTAPGRVMTPRPASEQLVAAALRRLGEGPARVVDVGTGSGALAIAIAAAAPRVEVWATDTSRCAVALARANVRRRGLQGRVLVRHGDLLEPVPGSIELIVANLPYLPASAAVSYPELAAEPGAAVFAGGDGLGPYRRVIGAAAKRLTPGGALVIQLHRRVLGADRNELAALRAVLAGAAPTSLYARLTSSRTPQPVRLACPAGRRSPPAKRGLPGRNYGGWWRGDLARSSPVRVGLAPP